jgi:hypothetical protein
MPASKMSGWTASALLGPESRVVKLKIQGGKESIAKSEAAFSLAYKAEVSSQNRGWRGRVNLCVPPDETTIIVMH